MHAIRRLLYATRRPAVNESKLKQYELYEHDIVYMYITHFIFSELYMLSSVRLSVACLSSVTFVHPTQAIEIFGNVSTPFGTLATCDLSIKILRRSSQANPSGGEGGKLKKGSQI